MHVQGSPASTANPVSSVWSRLETVMAFKAVEIELSVDERAALEEIVRAPTSEQRMVTRARVVLLAAEGKPNRQIAPEVGLSEQKERIA